MSDEQLSGGGISVETPHAERAPYENGNRVASPGPAMTNLKAVRDQGTELFNTVGILALAAIETADVVVRATGRTLYQATTDGSRGTFEMAHELTHTAHDILVDTAQIAVDTMSDLGEQMVRGATILARQGRELSGIFSETGQGLFRFALSVLRQPERQESAKPVTAVPIIVN